MMNNLSFISNNVKGIQAIFRPKRIKMFEYLKNYVTSNGFIFLQETHSFIKDKSARQGDPISTCLFILVLEILFHLIK